MGQPEAASAFILVNRGMPYSKTREINLSIFLPLIAKEFILFIE